MRIDTCFPSAYLKASDLGESQPVVTIDRVAVEPVGRKKEMKPVVYFTGKTKGVILNKTNSKKIADIAGSHETDDWVGVQIKLYATEVEFSGEQVEAIRIKSPKQTAKPTPAPKPPEHDGDDDVVYDDSEPF